MASRMFSSIEAACSLRRRNELEKALSKRRHVHPEFAEVIVDYCRGERWMAGRGILNDLEDADAGPLLSGSA